MSYINYGAKPDTSIRSAWENLRVETLSGPRWTLMAIGMVITAALFWLIGGVAQSLSLAVLVAFICVMSMTLLITQPTHLKPLILRLGYYEVLSTEYRYQIIDTIDGQAVKDPVVIFQYRLTPPFGLGVWTDMKKFRVSQTGHDAEHVGAAVCDSILEKLVELDRNWVIEHKLDSDTKHRQTKGTVRSRDYIKGE